MPGAISIACTSAPHVAVPGDRLAHRRLGLEADLHVLAVGHEPARHARRDVHGVAGLERERAGSTSRNRISPRPAIWITT